MTPSFDRRDFLRTMGGLALASTVGGAQSLGSMRRLIVPESRTPRVLVLTEEGFPTIEGIPLSRRDLEQAFAGWELHFLPCGELPMRLRPGEIDLLVTPYGSAFPEAAWESLLAFLVAGGSWVNLGGTPLAVPVRRDGPGWRRMTRNPNAHKRIGITQSFCVPTEGVARAVGNDVIPGSEQLIRECTASTVHELYVRFTTTIDFPSESGTSGPRDATLRPVLVGLSSSGRPIAAPIVVIDRMQGEFAGGRWVFAAFEGTLTPKGIRLLGELALEDSFEFSVLTPFACYYPGEQPLVQLHMRRPRGSVESFVAGPCALTVRDERGRDVASLSLPLEGTGTIATGSSREALKTKRRLEPGLYTIHASVPIEGPGSPGKVQAKTVNGFWIFDQKLLHGGTPLSAGTDFLIRDGKPYPVTGTTYMSSDVHRKFLFEPNPALWDRDMRAMKEAGINMIRTGIWTGWRSFVLDSGSVNEGALRALDAFLLTAHRYDIPVIFTFFAFVPEMWGGTNPYLDRRALDAQREFLAVVAQRYSRVDDLIWDLINEPSFGSPRHLWSCRPNYDPHEAAAWSEWLKHRHAPDGTDDGGRSVRERWRATPDESLGVPSLQEFADVNIFEDRRPLKTLDFRLFAQDMFIRWIREMTAALRTNGNTKQLITVGQDEAGTSDSPNPQFFSGSVDFTSIHNWWLNADVLWDSVMTKAPGKPNLVEETGVMFYETIDSAAWRSEAEVRNLLERKMALSLGARGAGFIQWIWNTNSYMALDNEVAIGFHRADGTAKPELEPLLRFSQFFRRHGHLLVDQAQDDVVMVIPHSQMFSVRNHATAATKACVRIMHHACRFPLTALSEYDLSSIPKPPPLILLPSARVLTDGAWKVLTDLVRQGTTLAVTGAIEEDEYWRPSERLSALGVPVKSLPVAREERLRIDGTEYAVSFRADKLQRVEKGGVEDGGALEISRFTVGSGSILWSPLPLELSDSDEPIRAFYALALRVAGLQSPMTLTPDEASILVRPSIFRRSVLYTVVSEAGSDMSVDLTDRASGVTHRVTIPAGRAEMLLIDRATGAKIGTLEPARL